MSRFPFISVILLSLLLHPSASCFAQESYCVPVKALSESELAFQSGEKMYFTMHYEFGAINSDVGSAQVALDTVVFNGQKVFRCVAKGKTTRLFDFFFKVREDFRSWFTVDGLQPVKFSRSCHEGHYRATNLYLYDWSDEGPHIDADLFSTKQGQRSEVLPLTRCTFDLPSLFYFARNIDWDNLEQGVKYPMTFAIDDEIFNVYFIMHGRETIKVKGLGTVKTVRFAAKLLEGEVFKGDQDMRIWISDDDNRLPVYVEAPILVGVASGRLHKVEGLKHPFTALTSNRK